MGGVCLPMHSSFEELYTCKLAHISLEDLMIFRLYEKVSMTKQIQLLNVRASDRGITWPASGLLMHFEVEAYPSFHAIRQIDDRKSKMGFPVEGSYGSKIF